MISLYELEKSYGNNGTTGPQILQNVSLSLPRGEFTCVLGPSGCGKTTLLNLIAGFTRPTSGNLHVDGCEITGPGPDRGVVFQEATLFPWLTVLKNVEFGLRQQGKTKGTCTEEAMHCLGLVGMADQANAYPHTLSGGMKQRVAIARVLALKPDVLLMDEPFSALDANTRERLQDELLRLWEMFGQTVFYVTHSVEEAAFLADRVIIMGPSPHNIRADIQIDLPRPRMRYSQEMEAVVHNLRHELNTLPCCIGPSKGKIT
ncbi:ABC transporter ATP-binding protein [Desulfoluna sp.]|uniref:ABC transporter ATP-binding protein n=1 Tax=Desulfoluna sp. TaxID=2045199 RepID=UPI00262D3B8D|nr:ABC transporter ATP-binding protein [Desulfoluna sp.]